MIQDGMHRAGYFRRLAAAIYDLFLACSIYIVAGAVGFLLFLIPVSLGFFNDVRSFSDVASSIETQHLLSQWIFSWGMFWVVYFYLWCWKKGQTLGMRAWRLKVAFKHTSEVSWLTLLSRFFWSLAGLGNLIILFRKDNLALQDYFSHSEVLVLEISKNSKLSS